MMCQQMPNYQPARRCEHFNALTCCDGFYHIVRTKSKSMAMCGNNIQRVKIVIDDKIIEQVTEFKYEGWDFNSANYLFTTDTK